MRLFTSRILAGSGVILAVTAMALTVTAHQDEQSRVEAAQQLVLQAPTLAPLPSLSAVPTPSVTATSAPPPVSSLSPVVAPTLIPPPSVATVYPLKEFTWSAAGIRVPLVTMDRATWQDQATKDGVDPQLTANGFDPVGHWLQGTGPDGVGQIFDQHWQSIILAAHTCYGTDSRLCNDTTFPFNRLSYDGWAVGQQATITDGANHVFDMTLVSREVVSKSGFAIDNDPCEVQVFTCNKQDPHNEATLVTFKRSQCKA